jgi:thiosulfate/3-mercaptopyruvate sulfurtransferase
LEPYEKIYVAPAFLETDHGQIACTECHGGDPQDPDWQTAHGGLVKDPTFPDPANACGECHPDISADAPTSLHYTIAPIGNAITLRMGAADPEVQAALTTARERHCSQCHASCGQCHVSRPDYVNGGFLAQHQFQKSPPMETTCASCHGGRVFAEFTGLNRDIAADTHFEDADMTCMDCHKEEQMHAPAEGVTTRLQSPRRPRCEACHPEAAAQDSDHPAHKIHRRKVACQVCHAQAIKQCYGCHVGTDTKGIAFFKCRKSEMGFKIGRNPAPVADRPYLYSVKRHPPVVPQTFDYYSPSALKQFGQSPTWKECGPHTIQRLTTQNRACNNCHGNRDLFLDVSDLADWEIAANAAVVVPDDQLPSVLAEDALPQN